MFGNIRYYWICAFCSLHLHCLSCQQQFQQNSENVTVLEGGDGPHCNTGRKISLVSYEFQLKECPLGNSCVVPFQLEQKYLIHDLCSFKEKCSNLAGLFTAKTQNFTVVAIYIVYQCLDPEKWVFNFCRQDVTVVNQTVYLLYNDVFPSYKECQCFVKEGNFTVLLNDIRLQLTNSDDCSVSKLQINSAEYVCDGDDRMAFGSVFLTEFGEALTRAFISLTKSSVKGDPRMLWLTIQPVDTVSVECTSSPWTPIATQTNWWPTPQNDITVASENMTAIRKTMVRTTPALAPEKAVTQDAQGKSEPLTVTTVVTVTSGTVLLAITITVIYALKRNDKIKCLRRPESKNGTTPKEQDETSRISVPESAIYDLPHAGCMQHMDGACECNNLAGFSEGTKSSDNGEYCEISEPVTQTETVYEQFQDNFKSCGTEYSYLDSKECIKDRQKYEIPRQHSEESVYPNGKTDDEYLSPTPNDDYLHPTNIHEHDV